MNTAQKLSYTAQDIADSYVTSRALQRDAEAQTKVLSTALLAVWDGSFPLEGVLYVRASAPAPAPDGKAAIALLAGAAGPLAALAALAAAPPASQARLERQLRIIVAGLDVLRTVPTVLSAGRAASVRVKSCG